MIYGNQVKLVKKTGKVLKNQQSWRMLIAVPTAADVAAAGDTEVQPDVVY